MFNCKKCLSRTKKQNIQEHTTCLIFIKSFYMIVLAKLKTFTFTIKHFIAIVKAPIIKICVSENDLIVYFFLRLIHSRPNLYLY